jgi:hypothetical protein
MMCFWQGSSCGRYKAMYISCPSEISFLKYQMRVLQRLFVVGLASPTKLVEPCLIPSVESRRVCKLCMGIVRPKDY